MSQNNHLDFIKPKPSALTPLFSSDSSNEVFRDHLQSMSKSLQSISNFEAHKISYWQSHLGRLTNITECLKTLKKSFQFDAENKKVCISIRTRAELKSFDGIVKILIAENEGLKSCASNNRKFMNSIWPNRGGA